MLSLNIGGSRHNGGFFYLEVFIIPTPDTSGLPPFANFEDMKSKINELVAKYNNLLVNLDSLNVVSLTADHIDTGTLNADLVTIRSDLTTGFIQIDKDGMVVNNGTFDTFKVSINGEVTMTSALIQSATGFPRIVMDPSGDLFGAYTSATNSIVVGAFDSGSNAPYLEFTNGAMNVSMDLTSGIFDIGGNSDARLQFPSGDLDLRGRDNFLYADNLTHLPSWNDLYADSLSESLQDALNDKATVGTSTSLSGAHNHGIPHNTVLMVSGGGTVTFSAAGDHSHTQV